MAIEQILVTIGCVISVVILLIMLLNESNTVKNIRMCGKHRIQKFHHICGVLINSNHKFIEYDESRITTLKKFVESDYIYGYDLNDVIRCILQCFSKSHNFRFSSVIGKQIDIKYHNHDSKNLAKVIDDLYDDLNVYIDYYDQKSSYVELAEKYKVKI